MTEKMSCLVKMKMELKEIFFAGLNAVKPNVLIQNRIKICKDNLIIKGENYTLGDKVYLVGFGKAVMGMAMEVEKMAGSRLTRGILSIPRGSIRAAQNRCDDSSFSVKSPTSVITLRENCQNNQPDMDTLKTTDEIINLVKSLESKDTLIVLVSGGGSALLAMPRETLSLGEKIEISKKLQNCGADIKELNVIRQKLSIIKGGGLGRMAYPARVITFILSDIIGDPINLIGSGPTCYSCKDPTVVVKILKKYNIFNDFDDKIKKLLSTSDESHDDKQFFNKQNEFIHVNNIIIGNNLSAINAARNKALTMNLNTFVLFNDIEGLVGNVSQVYVKSTRLFCEILDKSLTEKKIISKTVENCHFLRKFEKRIDDIFNISLNKCEKGFILIGGGEPSVIIKGSSGKGGRNQELALQFSIDWFQETEKNTKLKDFYVLFLAVGTDGQDGPTDAAGAFGYAKIVSENTKVVDYLRNNDSYNFYSNYNFGCDLIKTGFTGTNVMDLHFIYIKRKDGLLFK